MVKYAGYALLFVLLVLGPCGAAGGVCLAAAPDEEAVAAAPEQEPAFAPARNPSYAKFEKGTLGGERATKSSLPPESTPASPWSVVGRIFLGVVALTGLFVGVLALVRRFLPGRSQVFNCAAMEVLGRSFLDSRRSLALVRVGARVLVLGVAPERLDMLAEVSAPDEVEEILRQARPASEMGKTVFQNLLQRNIQEQQAKEEAAASGGEAARLAREMDGIHARLRGMRTAP